MENSAKRDGEALWRLCGCAETTPLSGGRQSGRCPLLLSAEGRVPDWKEPRGPPDQAEADQGLPPERRGANRAPPLGPPPSHRARRAPDQPWPPQAERSGGSGGGRRRKARGGHCYSGTKTHGTGTPGSGRDAPASRGAMLEKGSSRPAPPWPPRPGGRDLSGAREVRGRGFRGGGASGRGCAVQVPRPQVSRGGWSLRLVTQVKARQLNLITNGGGNRTGAAVRPKPVDGLKLRA